MTTTTESGAALVAAHWRAMPVTRMLDYGVDYADVLAMQERTSAGIPWDEAAEALADAHLERAATAMRDGNLITSLAEYRSAAAALVFAQMAFNFDIPRKRDLYARLIDTLGRAADLATPAWERLRLPLGNGYLAGWLVRPKVPALGTVIVFGGQSGWGAAYLRCADAFAERGLATILAEGPGQGETRLDGGVLLDVDIAAAFGAFVEHALADSSLGGSVGVWGNSLGGLYAAHTAAADSRVGACCVNGAPAVPRLLDFRTFREQALAMLGTKEADDVERNFARLRFDPQQHRIDCPLLVLHGGNDAIVTLDDQRPFLDAARNDTATLRIWDDGEHTIYNHSFERTAFVADWFAHQLTRT
ncbi:alpha/beta hydrolase family protein [Antrihabitans stalactiti]|uniref:Dipeptidyl aminopeptidase n=1 Tax=Antrihabitans stalactiti TaxID=2584121 RepID=A0A848KNI6_9NOCA|nr:prolyl oligopeptidase family serine peptidase [Antrihabitans stalactiti]NMN99508.1 dipeptidyl aminopeptidase [Antrihabitans stalactiti]